MLNLKNNRYWVFAINSYYPKGGVNDVFLTLSDMQQDNYFIELGKALNNEGVIEVFDSEQRKIVRRFKYDYCPPSCVFMQD